ncbi:hypothetical protein [Serinicoccus kebangsaanensis]|uniref:hypothetical protein n=1 Tax=Serinicoccus kebangsaanensis TaxID=2602069 RepID=UPI00124EBA8F|nr:hypothetical protein [Serinicoccus kebangsaanensis]
MSFPLTKIMAAATAGYAVFAAARPRHLASALDEHGPAARATDRLARTYAVRDLSTSALAFVPGGAPVAALLRITGDLGDAAILGSTVPPSVRAKVVGVPLAWGVLNTAALALDLRGSAGRVRRA